MSMTTRILHTGRLLGAIILIGTGMISIQSCSKNNVSAGGTSIYSNPNSIKLTPQHLVFMLRQSYANFNKAAPKSDINAILNAPDDDAAKKAYDDAIDDFVDGGAMTARWKEYARSATGVGSAGGNANDENRFVENLFAQVVLSGDPISEFFLATYAVDDEGNQTTNGYMDSIPDEVKAGYVTTSAWTGMYINQFKFQAIREQIGFGLCLTFPITAAGFYSWTDDQLNTTYEESGGIACKNCHSHSNPYRYAWHTFRFNSVYDPLIAQGNNQYQMEADNNGFLTLEPRDANDDPIPTATAEASMYKLTPNGPILSTPRILAQEIVANEHFAPCMVERFLSVFLNIEEGHPGQNYVAPANFSGNEAKDAFLNEMVAKFNELDQVPKDFFKFFLKSKTYLVLAVNPEDLDN